MLTHEKVLYATYSPNNQPPGQTSSYPKFLIEADEVSCENEGIVKESLPPCPDGPGLHFLPRTYPTHSLFVGYTIDHEQVSLIQNLIHISSRTEPKVPVLVLAPRGAMQKAQEDLAIAQTPSYKNLVKIIQTPSNDTSWPQDYFEFGVDGRRGEVSLVDLPYRLGQGENVSTAVALACRMDMISQIDRPVERIQELAGDLGGNIEAVTDQIVAIGNNMSRGLRESLRESFSQEFVEFDVSWLDVGHVDEVISIVPKAGAERPGACGFDVLFASPGLAWSLVSSATAEQRKVNFQLQLKTGSQAPRFNVWDCPKNRDSELGCKILYNSSRVYEKRISSGLMALKKAIKRKHQCSGVRFVPLPVFFLPNWDKSRRWGTNEDAATTIEPNPINNTLINDHLLIPQQRVPLFLQYTKNALSAYNNLKVSFLEGRYAHRYGGGLHCSINVRRSCAPSVPASN